MHVRMRMSTRQLNRACDYLGMKLGTYEAIVSIIEKEIHEKDCMKKLAKEFPSVSSNTLLSIYSQQYQAYTKSVHGLHRKPETMEQYYKEFNTSCGGQDDAALFELLLNMSNKIHFSPVLFARIILEQYILHHNLLPANMSAPNHLVSQWIKNIGKIPDSRLQEQVKKCIINDTNYGPLAENIKHSVGYEYEFILKEEIDALQIPYLDERALRLRGYDKTPDFKLEVPVAIGNHIINWVESKASFGDKQNHSRYLEEQFWSYQNRYGPGLVIYWFGFVEELDVHTKQGIMLMDHFPDRSTITTLNQSLNLQVT